MGLAAGDIIDDKYRIVRLLGEGGMGSVYEGENTRIRRRVAIKVINASLISNPEILARFEREAQAAGRIGNDHILEVLDLGSLASGERYMVLEYLDGETLFARMQRLGKLSPAQLVPLARQFLSALGAAHAAGIIHRDLKPENIFILRGKAGRADFVKLIDFGVSKFANLGPDAFRVTRAGTVVGTPIYMSPEQARGTGETDERSDIYAVGVILYEAITSKVPFEGVESFNDLMFKIALDDPPAPRTHVPELDPSFEAIILKAMAREPAKRWSTVDELANALEDWANARGIPLSIAPPKTPRTSSPDFGFASQPNLPISANVKEGFAPTLPNETPPAIESSPILDDDDLHGLAGFRPSKTVKLAMGGLGAAALIGLVLIVSALASSGSSSTSAAGAARGSATASAVAPPPTSPTTEALPDPPPGSSPMAITASSAAGVTSVAARPTTRPPGVGNVLAKPGASAKPAASAKKPSKTDFGY